MGIKVKARQTKLSVGPSKGEYRFIMQAEIYSTLKQEKVISEASIRSGIPKGSLQAAWEAIGGPPRDIPLPCLEWVPCASACKPRLSLKWKM